MVIKNYQLFNNGQIQSTLKKPPRIIDLPLEDRPTQSIDIVKDIVKEIQKAIDAGVNILVNCNVGMSRSTAVLLYYLIHTNDGDMSLLDAWIHLRESRPLILPNLGFLMQLMRIEKDLRGTSSVPVDLVRRHPMAWAQDDIEDRIKDLSKYLNK